MHVQKQKRKDEKMKRFINNRHKVSVKNYSFVDGNINNNSEKGRREFIRKLNPAFIPITLPQGWLKIWAAAEVAEKVPKNHRHHLSNRSRGAESSWQSAK